MPYLASDPADPLSFTTETRGLGQELQESHLKAAPFPHTVIDDFLPRTVIDACLAHFPDSPQQEGQTFDRPQERLKSSYNPDEMTPDLRGVFYAFNSVPFIRIVENITGIKGLIPDPYFMGAGFHEIANGGHLSVHVDFNHHKPMNLERRVNLLIYLNDDWQDSYGGQLELWSEDMSECVQSIVPVANRAALFTLSPTSWHGNPTPVAHPGGVTRKSIALYYTSTWDDKARSRTTQFKPRKGTEDKTDWQVKVDEALTEFLPPVLARPARRLSKRFLSS